MTALQVAQHFSAKKTGRGKWIAKCPAHPDRHASMTVTEGKTGVLIRCWSNGCNIRDIVESAGLKMDHLFYTSSRKLDPKVRAEMERKQRAGEHAAKEVSRRVRYWLDETRKWEAVAGLLFSHMMQGHDDAAEQWHRAIDIARSRNERMRQWWPDAPEVSTYRLVRRRKDITEQFVGKEIARIIGL
jgi:hypothetical protein